jgi:CRISPR-associated exonuclease Cas4
MMVEQEWADNVHTAEGTLLHQRVDAGEAERRGDLIILRSLMLRSLRLGLVGKADCVEATADPAGATLPGYAGCWRLRPVEYKHGNRRDEAEYEAQLCAQAICLEEMFGVEIADGDLFYAADHRRMTITFGPELRQRVEETAHALHAMQRAATLPPPHWSPRCKGCSLIDICGPRLKRSAASHLQALADAARGE